MHAILGYVVVCLLFLYVTPQPQLASPTGGDHLLRYFPRMYTDKTKGNQQPSRRETTRDVPLLSLLLYFPRTRQTRVVESRQELAQLGVQRMSRRRRGQIAPQPAPSPTATTTPASAPIQPPTTRARVTGIEQRRKRRARRRPPLLPLLRVLLLLLQTSFSNCLSTTASTFIPHAHPKRIHRRRRHHLTRPTTPFPLQQQRRRRLHPPQCLPHKCMLLILSLLVIGFCVCSSRRRCGFCTPPVKQSSKPLLHSTGGLSDEEPSHIHNKTHMTSRFPLSANNSNTPPYAPPAPAPLPPAPTPTPSSAAAAPPPPPAAAAGSCQRPCCLC